MKNLTGSWPPLFPYALLLWIGLGLQRWYLIAVIDYPGFEHGIKGSYISSGIVFDLFLVCVIAGIYSLIQLLISLLFHRRALWIFHLFALVVLCGNFALIQYFLITKIPLDESLFFFSWTELKTIVGTGERLSIGVLSIIAGSMSAYFLAGRWMLRHNSFRSARTAFILSVISVVSLCFSFFALYRNDEKPAAVALINSPFTYFSAESLGYFFATEAIPEGEVRLADFSKLDPGFLSSGTVSETYPLLNELPVESSWTALFRKKSDTPPNVVIIIVESLSSDLVGKRAEATGHVMPFLDSLSKKSIYFPNVLSTSERTYNVLPAVLTSLPNAPNGKMLQQIAYPNMWSLQGMLKKHYYSRFYCGVNLSFSNMTGFMKHIQTDYLASNFDRPAPKSLSGRYNFWGYPDHYIFDQSLSDLRKHPIKKKSRLDIFLTISTHDPYIYPEPEKYSRFVRQQLAKGKSQLFDAPRLNRRNQDLGAFTYTDASIKAYFERVKQLPDYENTIFIITGDHGTDLCATDELWYYKVPLIIYSPLLTSGRCVENVSSHLDITPTLINYLRVTYLPDLPSVVPFIGQQLDMRPGFRMDRTFSLTGSQQNCHLFSRGYALLPGELYRIDKRFRAVPVKDQKRTAAMKNQLKHYQFFSRYIFEQDHIINAAMRGRYEKTEEWETISKLEFPKNPAKKAESSIDIGGFVKHLPANSKVVRISVTAQTMLSREELIDSLPRMFMSLENTSASPSEMLAFYTILPAVTEPFKAGKWITINYTIVLKLSEFGRIPKEHEFRFYLVKNEGEEPKPMRNIVTEVSRERR